MKRQRVIVAVFAVIAMLTAIGAGVRWWRIPGGSRGLAARVDSIVATTPINGSFAVSAMTDERWERLFVFGAYQSDEAVRATLGFDWADAHRVVVELPESETALVFTSGNEVVTYTRFPRIVADFADLERPNGYGYDAVFKMGPGADGDRFPRVTVA